MRTQRNTVDYFPHEANASDGDTLTIIEGLFGNDGYAFWFKLLEKLARTENHYIDINRNSKWQLFCSKVHIPPEKAITIVEKLVELEAIDGELWQQGIIWSENLLANIEPVYKNRRRELPQKPVTTGSNGKTTGRKGITTSKKAITTSQSRVDRSIVDNTNEQFEQFWKAYPKKRNRGQAEKVFLKVNPDEQLISTILTALEQAKKSPQWLKDSGQFIPYPATWLNAKGWEDEIDKPKAIGSKWG